MLETALFPPSHTEAAPPGGKAKSRNQILKMRENDRMAGSVPAWEHQKTSKDKVMERLTYAARGREERFGTALSYAAANRYGDIGEKPFGFGDLVDMVNPLHHLPVVGTLYREATGDEIRPIARIIGGGVFGGPLGAASGLANVVIEEETGKDIGGNIASFVHRPADGNLRTDAQDQRTKDFSGIETAIEDLPGTVVRYTDLGLGKRRVYKQVHDDSDRMAGSVTHIYTEIKSTSPEERQPVRQVVLDPLPPLPAASVLKEQI